jgi:hypothetical protein
VGVQAGKTPGFKRPQENVLANDGQQQQRQAKQQKWARSPGATVRRVLQGF